MLINDDQQKKAADYLVSVNPERYYFEVFHDFMYLYDRNSRRRHHTRPATSGTVMNGYFGRVALYGFLLREL